LIYKTAGGTKSFIPASILGVKIYSKSKSLDGNKYMYNKKGVQLLKSLHFSVVKRKEFAVALVFHYYAT